MQVIVALALTALVKVKSRPDRRAALPYVMFHESRNT
jgi:hypothetical protein